MFPSYHFYLHSGPRSWTNQVCYLEEHADNHIMGLLFRRTEIEPMHLKRGYKMERCDPITVHITKENLTRSYVVFCIMPTTTSKLSPQNPPSPHIQQLQHDLQSTMRKQTLPKSNTSRAIIETPPIKQSHANRLNARLLNHDHAVLLTWKRSYLLKSLCHID